MADLRPVLTIYCEICGDAFDSTKGYRIQVYDQTGDVEGFLDFCNHCLHSNLHQNVLEIFAEAF